MVLLSSLMIYFYYGYHATVNYALVLLLLQLLSNMKMQPLFLFRRWGSPWPQTSSEKSPLLLIIGTWGPWGRGKAKWLKVILAVILKRFWKRNLIGHIWAAHRLSALSTLFNPPLSKDRGWDRRIKRELPSRDGAHKRGEIYVGKQLKTSS